MGQRCSVAEVNITKISQVTPEVTLFLRSLGFTDYYIIRIFALVGEAAQALTEDNPYWLLEEFPRMGFDKVDEAARKLGIAPDSRCRAEAVIGLCMRYYAGEGHSFAPYKDLCLKASEILEVSSELIEDVLEDMVFDGRLQLANVDGSRAVYFYGYYKAECSVAGKLAALENPPGGLKQVGGNIEAQIAKAEAACGIELSYQQKEAVRNALSGGVSVITGGPGTGKTTIINALISIIEGSGMKVAVAAPTGRAAKRVMETSRHFACTVHRLLEYFYDEESHYMAFGRNRERPLEQDVIIIDEASMLDLLLMEALCEALRPGTRLVLVGDADQLPSVGAGNVLADLIAGEYFFTARLGEIYRQSAQSTIILNAHRINSGQYPEFDDDFKLLRADKQQDIVNKIVELAGRFPLDSVQVLTPVKKGIVGSVNLNARLQEAFNPPAPDKPELKFGQTVFRVGDRVMQTKNDYRMEYRIGAPVPPPPTPRTITLAGSVSAGAGQPAVRTAATGGAGTADTVSAVRNDGNAADSRTIKMPASPAAAPGGAAPRAAAAAGVADSRTTNMTATAADARTLAAAAEPRTITSAVNAAGVMSSRPAASARTTAPASIADSSTVRISETAAAAGRLYKTPDGKPDGKGVFNGEIGIVAAIDGEMKTVTVVYDGFRWVEYQYIQLDEIEPAYAITVHKSQGSEFPIVILPMTWFPPILATRSLVYTAVTRGKEAVYIVGNPAYMNAMVDNNQSRSRNSGLGSRLTGMYMGIG